MSKQTPPATSAQSSTSPSATQSGSASHHNTNLNIGVMKESSKSRRQTLNRQRNDEMNDNISGNVNSLTNGRINLGEGSANDQRSIVTVNPSDRSLHDPTVASQMKHSKTGDDTRTETTEQRFLRLLKIKKELESRVDDEQQQRTAAIQQLQRITQEYELYKLSALNEKNALIQEHQESVESLKRQYEQEYTSLIQQHKVELKQRLIEKEQELKEADQRTERLQQLNINEIERQLTERITITLSEKYQKESFRYKEEIDNEKQRYTFVEQDLDLLKNKYKSLEDSYQHLQHESQRLEYQRNKQSLMIRDLLQYKSNGKKYKLLLKYMTIHRYCKEYQLRRKLIALHEYMTSFIYLLMNDSELKEQMLEQSEIHTWYKKSQSLMNMLKLQNHVQTQNQKKYTTNHASQSPSTRTSYINHHQSSYSLPTTTTSMNTKIAHHLPNTTNLLPTYMYNTGYHTRRYSLAQYQAEEENRRLQKQRMLENYNQQHSNKIIQHLLDVESVLRLSLQQLVEKKNHWKTTANSFFDRNTELTDISLQHEKAIEKLMKRVDKYKHGFLEVKQLYEVMKGRENRMERKHSYSIAHEGENEKEKEKSKEEKEYKQSSRSSVQYNSTHIHTHSSLSPDPSTTKLLTHSPSKKTLEKSTSSRALLLIPPNNPHHTHDVHTLTHSPSNKQLSTVMLTGHTSSNNGGTLSPRQQPLERRIECITVSDDEGDEEDDNNKNDRENDDEKGEDRKRYVVGLSKSGLGDSGDMTHIQAPGHIQVPRDLKRSTFEMNGLQNVPVDHNTSKEHVRKDGHERRGSQSTTLSHDMTANNYKFVDKLPASNLPQRSGSPPPSKSHLRAVVDKSIHNSINHHQRLISKNKSIDHTNTTTTPPPITQASPGTAKYRLNDAAAAARKNSIHMNTNNNHIHQSPPPASHSTRHTLHSPYHNPSLSPQPTKNLMKKTSFVLLQPVGSSEPGYEKNSNQRSNKQNTQRTVAAACKL